MKIAELASDPDLVPTNLSGFERSLRAGFIRIRLRGDQTLRGTANLSEVVDSQVSTVKTKLRGQQGELAAAAARASWIATQMDNYESAGKLLSLAEADIDSSVLSVYFASKLLPGTKPSHLQAKRKQTIATIVWWATASDPQLLDPQKQPDLLKLVDRRLRVAERMLYYVSENPRATWPDLDGANRLFDYPYSIYPNRVGEAAATFWVGPGGPSSYRFVRAAGKTPSEAVEKLFATPKTERSKRTLFYCDQVIESLHIEALMVAEKNSRGDHSWFNNLVTSKPLEWLRIDSPWIKNVTFLSSEDEPGYFEHKDVGIPDLQVGDHLIVFNHPLFSALLRDDEWQLENSIAVQVYPEPRVQGHGTQPMTLPGMKDHLLEQLNKELLKIQMKVEADPKVTNPTESPADPYPEIDLTVAGQPPRLGKAVRRVPPSQSEWVADSRKADWWIRWVPLSGREAEWELYTNTAATWDARRAHARTNQGVDIVVQDPAAHPNRSGFFFPLWKPLTQGTGSTGTPFRNAQGKLTAPLPTTVDEPMASLANWYFPSDFHRGRTTVIRPKAS